MELIALKGNPEEIGLQHGKLLKEKVAATWEFYSQTLFGNQMEILEEYGSQYLDVITAFNADYGVEIDALARGAGLPAWQIAVLNARTEIIHILMEKMMMGECTALYFAGSRILGQNWDWMEQLEPLFVVMRIDRDDGHQILQIAEPGIIGKIGLNSKGIGVCLNILSGSPSPVAVPVHILLRYVLDSASLDDALDRFQNMDLGTYSNILMADDQGHSVNMEFAGSKMKVVDYGEEIPIHTNHLLSELKEGRDNSKDLMYPNSTARFDRGKQILKQLDQNSGLEELKSVLRDAKNENDPICVKYKEILGMMIGTVSSVIMDLPNRTLHVTKGPPANTTYSQFSLKSA